MKDYEKDLGHIEETAEGARQEWLEALKNAKASKKEREQTISAAIAEHEGHLVELTERHDKARDALSEALMTGDSSAAEDLKAEIAAIDEEASDVRELIAALSGHNGAKAATELVMAAVEKYKAAIECAADACDQLRPMRDEVKAEIEHLERLHAKIEASLDRMTKRGTGAGTPEENELLALYEAAAGTIDVTGHHAGSDRAAALRFLRGQTKGIENIPALTGAGAANGKTDTRLHENLGNSEEA